MAIFDPTGTDFYVDEDAELREDVLERMIASMPFDLANSHYGKNILQVFANEIERMSAAMWAIKIRNFVALADEIGITWWEKAMNIPPDQVNVDLEARRDFISVQLRGRFTFHGDDFKAGLEILGGPIRDITLNVPTGEVNILFTNALTTEEVNKIEKYCLNSGPAHLQWVISSAGASTAFIAGMTTSETSNFV